MWDLGEVDMELIEIKLSDDIPTPVNLRNSKLSLSEIRIIRWEHNRTFIKSLFFTNFLSTKTSIKKKKKTASEYNRMVLDE